MLKGLLVTLVFLAGCADRPLALPEEIRDLGQRRSAPDLADRSPDLAFRCGDTLQLLAPSPDRPIPQNVQSLPCPPDPYHGSGYRLVFDWCPVVGATAYRLLMQAPNGVVNIDVTVSDSTYSETECDTFVIDKNLKGWTWSVTAIDGASAEGTFDFAPCRLEDGTACWAPD
jgi:hypothetical protein